MKKIYDYKTKTVKVYPVNESAGTGYCLYIEDYDGLEVANVIDLSDKCYATEDEAAEDIQEAFKEYLEKNELDIDLNDIVYDDEIEEGIEFTTEDGSRKWIVKIKPCENVETPEVESVDEAADATEERELEIEEVEDLLHKAIDNDFYLYFSNGNEYNCSFLDEKGEILDAICCCTPVLHKNGRIGLKNDSYGKFEIENLIMDVDASADDNASDTNDDLDSEANDDLENEVREAALESVDESKKESVDESKKESVDENSNESVTVRFSRFGSVFEHAEIEEAATPVNEDTATVNEDKSDDDDNKGDDNNSDDSGDNSGEGDGDDNKGDDENKSDDDDDKKDDDEKKDDDDEEVSDMEAVVLTVKKDDAEKCKEKLIEAGVAEEDIDIIEGDDDEDSKVRVDVNSVMELKDYLSGRGIDLEEEIGGKIVSDDDDEDSADDGGDSDSGDDNGGDDNNDDDDNLDDFNFDELGDIFGADEE